MGEQKRIFVLIGIMAVASLVVTGVTISLLYNTAFKQQEARLMEVAQSQARLIEAVGRFDAIHMKKDHLKGPFGAALYQVIDAHKHYKGFGNTGEFTLARREGDYIVFLLSHRHYDFDKPKPVSFDSEKAEPMRRALSGQSGIVVGQDYRGEIVLAAYEPVAVLNLGIVAKIDLVEIRSPFLRAGLIAVCIMILVVLGGSSLFFRVTNPIIRALMERTTELVGTNKQLKYEIEDHNRAKKALELSEERYALARRAGNIGVWDWNIHSDELYWSERIEPMFGLDHKERDITYKMFLESVHPEDRQYISDSVKASLEKGEKYNIEHRVVWPDGTIRWIREIGDVFCDENENPIRMLGVALDITEHKMADESLRESEEKFRSITSAALSAIVMCDNEGEIILWNEASESIFGWTAEEAFGRNLHDLLAPERYHDDHRKAFPVFIETGQGPLIGKTEELFALNKNGEEFPIELALSAVKIKGRWNAIGIINDISERKQAEEELHTAKEAAENANRAKSDFLASMSHELRTPLTAIIGFSDVLYDKYFGPLTEKQEEYIRDIRESGKHLLSLINDILDLSKVEAGKMDLELSKINIKGLLKSSLVMIKEKAFEHKISLDLKIPEDLSELEIQADERKLKQVMFNLLSNAAKFTPDGGAIDVEAKQDREELIISVSDTGIGIAPEDQEKIFDEFYQVDGGKKDKTPGTGLGLPLSRRLLEMHGGRLGVESKGKNKGSQFYFTLPLRVKTPDKRTIEPPITEINDGRAFLDHLENIISLSLRENRIFSLSCFYLEGENLQEKIPSVKEVLNKEKRADDLSEMDKNNNFYLVLQNTNYEGAKDVCDRIIQKVESIFEDLEISYSIATFPEDGETPEELIGKVTFLNQ